MTDTETPHGRTQELHHLEALLADVAVSGSSLVLKGPPGVGKSFLLRRVIAAARQSGFRVLRTDGTPAEMALPFAGLHRLLRPVMEHSAKLPETHRSALQTAFGTVDGPPPDLYRIALATLDLVSEVATRGAVLIGVDDLQWLDSSSADVLAFVARRLESDPIVLVATSRDGEDHGLPSLRLAPLGPAAASAVLASTAPHLGEHQRQSVLHAARGNPLALVELSRGLQGLGSDEEPQWIPITERLERTFSARASDLPSTTRAMLLLAALSDDASLAELFDAAASSGLDAGLADLVPAIDAGLVEVDRDRLAFCHPLIRSAVHQAAHPAEQHAAHLALAASLPRHDERRIWHRAGGTVGRDDDIAADLERAANRASQRGSTEDAATALEHAARLTTDPDLRSRRLLRAAELSLDTGRRSRGRKLLAQAETMRLDGVDKFRAAWIRELADDRMAGDKRRVAELVDLAEGAAAQGEVDFALRFLRAAALRGWFIVTAADSIQRTRMLTIVEQIDDGLDPRAILVRAQAAPVSRAAEVVQLLQAHRPDPAAPDHMYVLAHAAACVGDFHAAHAYFSASAIGLREQGRLAVLTQVLAIHTWSAIRCGEWALAASAADEGARVSRELRQPIWLATATSAQAMIAGLMGREPDALARADEAEQIMLPLRGNVTLATIQAARAMTAATAGRPDDAFHSLIRIYQPGEACAHPMQAAWAIGNLAEFAADAGYQDQALGELERVEVQALQSPSPGIHAAVSQARAMLAPPDEAEAAYLAALDHGLTAWPFERARTLLSYGAWLRRHRRTTDSRPLLREARGIFDGLGSESWSARAREELRASGEVSDDRELRVAEPLTPQERQIADLAAEGLTNREIGARLFLSHRTVSTYLYRTFPKLGITSRAGLHAALQRAPEPEGRDALRS